MRNIILASQSPRRKELMKKAGFEIEIVPSQADENISETEPVKVVCELSYIKAYDVYKLQENGSIVIGADTIVSIDGEILGKPKDKENAFEMISRLQGREHEVYTGVTFVYDEYGEVKTYTFYERTVVKIYPMSKEEINSYIETGDPLDKAGSYGIQGSFAIYVEKIDGDYNNVVGLPIAKVYQELKKLGLLDNN